MYFSKNKCWRYLIYMYINFIFCLGPVRHWTKKEVEYLLNGLSDTNNNIQALIENSPLKGRTVAQVRAKLQHLRKKTDKVAA